MPVEANLDRLICLTERYNAVIVASMRFSQTWQHSVVAYRFNKLMGIQRLFRLGYLYVHLESFSRFILWF